MKVIFGLVSLFSVRLKHEAVCKLDNELDICYKVVTVVVLVLKQ